MNHGSSRPPRLPRPRRAAHRATSRAARLPAVFASACLALLACACAAVSLRPASGEAGYLPAQKRVRGVIIDYRVQAPRGHGYQRGDFVGFYRPLARAAEPGAREAVGLGQVESVDGRTLVVGWSRLPADRRADRLDVHRLPRGSSFEKYLGQVLAADVEGAPESAGWFGINIGAADGVLPGDRYQVLGPPVGDAGVDGRSLGRTNIGVLEVVELPPDKHVCRARLIEGRAPAGHWLEWMGKNPHPVGDDEHVTILVTPFRGPAGEKYSELLYQRLDGIARASRGTIVIAYWKQPLDTTDPARIRRLGRQKGAHLVLWGEGRDDRALAESGAARGWVTPKLTFVHPEVAGEEQRMWSEIEMPLSEVTENTASKDRHISALAYRLVGMAQYRRNDYSQARIYLERSLAGEPADAAEARIALFWVRERLGDWPRAEKLAREIIDDGQKAGDARHESHGWYALGSIAIGQGRLDQALTSLRRSRDMDVELGDERNAAVTWGKIADIYYLQGKLDEALSIRQERALPVYKKLGDIREEAVTWGKIADIYYARGKLDEALSIRQERELLVYKKLGKIRSEAVTWGRIADIYHARGKQDEALSILQERALPVYKKLGDIRSEAVTWGRIADIYYDRGKLDEALSIRQERELPVYKKLGDIRSEAVTWGKIADIHARKGDLDAAVVITEKRAIPVLEKLRDQRSLLIMRAYLGLHLWARNQAGDRARARTLLQQAHATAQQMRLPEEAQILEFMKQLGIASPQGAP